MFRAGIIDVIFFAVVFAVGIVGLGVDNVECVVGFGVIFGVVMEVVLGVGFGVSFGVGSGVALVVGLLVVVGAVVDFTAEVVLDAVNTVGIVVCTYDGVSRVEIVAITLLTLSVAIIAV